MWKGCKNHRKRNWKSRVKCSHWQWVVGRFVKEMPLQFLCSAGELQGACLCTRLGYIKRYDPGLSPWQHGNHGNCSRVATHPHPPPSNPGWRHSTPRNLALLLCRTPVPPSKHTSWFNLPYIDPVLQSSRTILRSFDLYLREKAIC